MGVASSSQSQPIKHDGFESVDATFKDADCYCQWRFVYYASRWNRVLPSGVSQPPSPGSPTPLQPAPVPTLPGNNPAPGMINPYPGQN